MTCLFLRKAYSYEYSLLLLCQELCAIFCLIVFLVLDAYMIAFCWHSGLHWYGSWSYHLRKHEIRWFWQPISKNCWCCSTSTLEYPRNGGRKKTQAVPASRPEVIDSCCWYVVTFHLNSRYCISSADVIVDWLHLCILDDKSSYLRKIEFTHASQKCVYILHSDCALDYQQSA